MRNKEIREAAKYAGVYLWEIAERWGCNDGNFSRRLRRELPADEQEKIIAINQALAELDADGTLTELSVKYFGTDISKMS